MGLTYDIENRVKSITYPSSATNTFAYNGEDLRVQKVDSAGTANFVTDGASPASAVIKDGSAVYTPGLSERRGSASKFYHADALGSTRGITDSTQAVTDSLRYDAFGNVMNRTGSTPTPFGFVGASQYQTDGDSGLQLLGHRYYDPSIGRFLSSDPAKAGTNWYAYCDNNPLGETDPLGLLNLDQIIAAAGAAIDTAAVVIGRTIGGPLAPAFGVIGTGFAVGGGIATYMDARSKLINIESGLPMLPDPNDEYGAHPGSYPDINPHPVRPSLPPPSSPPTPGTTFPTPPPPMSAPPRLRPHPVYGVSAPNVGNGPVDPSAPVGGWNPDPGTFFPPGGQGTGGPVMGGRGW